MSEHECPRGEKARYATVEAAQKAAYRVGFAIQADLYPYECVCSWWHLTKTKPSPKPGEGLVADEADIQYLCLLPDIDFRAVVVHDSRGEAEPGHSAALRSPKLLPRWSKHLGQLLEDVEAQMAQRAADTTLESVDWRRRITNYRDHLLILMEDHKRFVAEDQRAQLLDGEWTTAKLAVLWRDLADALNALEAAGQLPSCESDGQEVRGSGRNNQVHRVKLSDGRDGWQYVSPVAQEKEQV